MAAQDYFDAPIAYNPDADALVANAVFQVFATTDAGFVTPLAVADPVSSTAISELRSSSIGVLPSFKVAGNPTQVILKSGAFVTLLTSRYGMLRDGGFDADAVASAMAQFATIPTTVQDAIDIADIPAQVEEFVESAGVARTESLVGDVFQVRFNDGVPFIEADEAHGITSKLTPPAASLPMASLNLAGSYLMDLEGTGWAHAVMFKNPTTGQITVQSGVRDDGTIYPTPGSILDQSGPGWVQNGDSMSLGLAARMATLTGATWVDMAIGGERSYDIAARAGASPIWLAVDGNSIPASGGVFVTPYFNTGAGAGGGFQATSTLIKQGVKGVNPASLAGVPGTFSWSDSDNRYSFTRLAPGSAVAVPYKEPLLPFARDAYAGYNQIFQLGRNNAGDLDRVLEDTHSMVLWQTGGRRKFLVVGIMNSTTEISGTGSWTAITALNNALKREFGFRFIDMRRKLIDNGLAMAGLTPTSQDTTDIANDTIPTQLRATGDPLHLNEIAKDVQAQIVYARMKQIGWY